MKITGAHLYAYDTNSYSFKCPPVSHALWDRLAWCFYVYSCKGFRDLDYCLRCINQMYINDQYI